MLLKPERNYKELRWQFYKYYLLDFMNQLTMVGFLDDRDFPDCQIIEINPVQQSSSQDSMTMKNTSESDNMKLSKSGNAANTDINIEDPDLVNSETTSDHPDSSYDA